MADTGRLEELKRKFDENPKRYFAPLANEYRKAGNAELAIELCRTYLPQQPNHMSGYIVYGQALHDAGQTEESAAVFRQALTLDPENIIALRHLGDISRNAGDNVGAMRWYGKVLELDPRNEEISAFIISLAAPGTLAFAPPVVPERQAPPTIRPEPAPDESAVSLEDIVSEPDVAQTRFPVEEAETAGQTYEQISEQSFESDESDQPFEITEWPTALDTQGDPDAGLVIEGPWHTPQDVESHDADSHGADENGDQSADEDPAPLRFADFMPQEDAAFAPTPEEMGETPEAAHADAEPEEAANDESVADEPAAEEPVADEPAAQTAVAAEMPAAATEQGSAPDETDTQPVAATEAAAGQESPAPDHDGSPFVTETMAELYLSQGLRGEALAIYRKLVIKRDDPALRQKIADLEATPPEQPATETVRAFFSRIGARRPDERVEIAAQRETSQHQSPLGALFGSAKPDSSDVSAAQRLSGAFGNPQSGASHA